MKAVEYLHQLPAVRPNNSFFSEFQRNFFQPSSPSLFEAGIASYFGSLFIS